MSELKPLYNDHYEEVPRRVWNQIEGKLSHTNQRKKFIRLRSITAIAACLVLAAVLSWVKLGFTQDDPQLFTSSETYKSMVFEDLNVETNLLFDYDQVFLINAEVLKTDPSFGKRIR